MVKIALIIKKEKLFATKLQEIRSHAIQFLYILNSLTPVCSKLFELWLRILAANVEIPRG